jgi:hypothetical protein
VSSAGRPGPRTVGYELILRQLIHAPYLGPRAFERPPCNNLYLSIYLSIYIYLYLSILINLPFNNLDMNETGIGGRGGQIQDRRYVYLSISLSIYLSIYIQIQDRSCHAKQHSMFYHRDAACSTERDAACARERDAACSTERDAACSRERRRMRLASVLCRVQRRETRYSCSPLRRRAMSRFVPRYTCVCLRFVPLYTRARARVRVVCARDSSRFARLAEDGTHTTLRSCANKTVYADIYTTGDTISVMPASPAPADGRGRSGPTGRASRTWWTTRT